MSEIEQMRRRLESLERDARRNEAMLARLFEGELDLLAAKTLPQLCKSLFRDTAALFRIEAVKLVLHDPENLLPGLFALRGHDVDDWPQLELVSELDPADRSSDGESVWLGAFDRDLDARLGDAGTELASVARIPLCVRDRRVGLLTLGSGDRDRYATELGTQFLQRFGAVLAIATCNIVEREQLALDGLTDALTGLPNRRYFMQRLHQELARAMRHGRSIACVYIDVDRFKAINDNHGHGAGDQVLRELSRRLRRAVRTGDVPARIGGEEFALLLPETDDEAAAELAERVRVRLAVSAVPIEGDASINITASFGVASGSYAGASGAVADLANGLLETADSALLEAKASGRNRVVRAPPADAARSSTLTSTSTMSNGSPDGSPDG